MASSASTDGATIEVWLDSIDTGLKIGSCKIENTASLKTFSTFNAKTTKITGRHDVYLKFTGTDTDVLLNLKSIVFVPTVDNLSAVTIPESDIKGMRIFPSPAHKNITIQSGTAFNKLEVYNLQGELVFLKSETESTKSATYDLPLPKGTYIAKVLNNNKFESTKLIVK